MKETKFIEQNQEKWADFEQMLRDNRRDPDKLNDLFIQITDDLSYARTFYPNRSVRMYLNSLAQRVFHNVYRGKRFPVERLKRFWTDEMPHILWAERRAMILSFSIFALAFTIGVVSSRINPEFAAVILGDEYVAMTEANIKDGNPMAVYQASGPVGMTLGIAANNLFVALRTAIFGVLASIGTVFILLYNGVMVGAFQYFFIERGVFLESFLTIWIHGTLEISAIIIAGAAGLVAGSGLLFPGTYTRIQAFQISMRRGLKIFIGMTPLLVLAAFFEGFLTRYTNTPDVIRALFILSSLALVLWYFVWLPWHKARNDGFRHPIHDKQLPHDRQYVVDFNLIKSSGELLSDVFTTAKRNPKTVLWSIFGSTALFAAAAFGLATGKAGETFVFPSGNLGVLDGAKSFFDFEARPWLYLIQVALFSVIATAAGRALEGEMDEVRPRRPWNRIVAGALLMALPVPFFFWGICIVPNILSWTVAILAFPVLALWMATMYFETANPLRALSRTFTLMRWGQGLTLGFLITNLSLLLFLFLDSGVWTMILQFFSWLVPPGEGNMQAFLIIATACAASVVLYTTFLLFVLGGALQYFSLREVNDANALHEHIGRIGQARQIRGLARE